MKSTLSLLLVLLNHFFMPRHNAQLRLLKAQIAILRARIPTQRIILSPAEKAELLRIGAECGHEIDGLLEVARPATYRRWLARMRAGTPFKAVGRPRLSDHIRRFRPYLLGKWICGAGVAIVVVGRARSGGRSRPGQRDLAWRCSTRTSRWPP